MTRHSLTATLILVSLIACSARPDDPIDVAAFTGDLATVRAANLDPTDPRAGSALIWASRGGQPDVIRLVVGIGVPPDIRDHRNGWTPLLHAVHKNQMEAVSVLLELGADPNLSSRSGGITPLFMAAGYGRADMTAMLVNGGADPIRPIRNGETPLDAAVLGSTDIDRYTRGDCQPETVAVLLDATPSAAPGKLSVVSRLRERSPCAAVDALLSGSTNAVNAAVSR